MKKMRVIKAGEMLTVTTGEYSDYSVHGVFEAVNDIDTEALKECWLSEHPEQREEHRFQDGLFLGWVFRQGCLRPISTIEWHLGSYGTAGKMEVCDEKSYDPDP